MDGASRGPGTRAERALAAALAVATLGWVAHFALVPMSETDLFFHLKIGDLIRATGAIPFRNLFSFTFPDQPDPDLAWGFQVLVSSLYGLGGFAGNWRAIAPALAAERRVIVPELPGHGGSEPLRAAPTLDPFAEERSGPRCHEDRRRGHQRDRARHGRVLHRRDPQRDVRLR